MPLIRKEPRASNGWNNGDLDVAFQLLTRGMVHDGCVVSKEPRDHLVAGGYAVRHGGMQAMTGKGVFACLTSPPMLAYLLRRWRRTRSNPLVASPESIKRAMAL